MSNQLSASQVFELLLVLCIVGTIMYCLLTYKLYQQLTQLKKSQALEGVDNTVAIAAATRKARMFGCITVAQVALTVAWAVIVLVPGLSDYLLTLLSH